METAGASHLEYETRIDFRQQKHVSSTGNGKLKEKPLATQYEAIASLNVFLRDSLETQKIYGIVRDSSIKERCYLQSLREEASNQ